MGIRRIIQRNKQRKKFEKETFARELNIARAKSLPSIVAERKKVQGRVNILMAQNKELDKLKKSREQLTALENPKSKKNIKLSKGVKRFKSFAENVGKNVQSKQSKPNPIFSGVSGSTNSIYTTSSGSNPYDFSGSSNKKKSKKKRGKTITIRL